MSWGSGKLKEFIVAHKKKSNYFQLKESHKYGIEFRNKKMNALYNALYKKSKPRKSTL